MIVATVLTLYDDGSTGEWLSVVTDVWLRIELPVNLKISDMQPLVVSVLCQGYVDMLTVWTRKHYKIKPA